MAPNAPGAAAAAASISSTTLSAARPAINTATRAITGAVARIPWSQLPEKTRAWITANPTQTGVLVVQGAVVILPGLVSVPLLSLFGFTSVGPQAGSIAATAQSLIGNVPGGSVFAYVQSAGMAGYGAAAVNTGVSVMAGGVALATNLISKVFRRG